MSGAGVDPFNFSVAHVQWLKYRGSLSFLPAPDVGGGQPIYRSNSSPSNSAPFHPIFHAIQFFAIVCSIHVLSGYGEHDWESTGYFRVRHGEDLLLHSQLNENSGPNICGAYVFCIYLVFILSNIRVIVAHTYCQKLL
eukprot:jgi/Botrbrau1/6576/Bobra.0189s0003.1